MSIDPGPALGPLPQVGRLVAVMAVLREQCPWDAQQTHRSLVPYLLEEALEVVEAIESDDRTHLREELGDLLLQVVFHSEIDDDLDLNDVARGIADKLVARHPHVFVPAAGGGPEALPADLHASWEQRKAVEKGRTSALQGIPEQMSALARAAKVVARSRSRRVPLPLPDAPVTADEVGAQVLALVARAQASGVDAEQAVRDALRALEGRVAAAEAGAR